MNNSASTWHARTSTQLTLISQQRKGALLRLQQPGHEVLKPRGSLKEITSSLLQKFFTQLNAPKTTSFNATPRWRVRRLVIRACPRSAPQVVERALRAKKIGHEQRKTLPCPKLGGYDFVAKHNRNPQWPKS